MIWWKMQMQFTFLFKLKIPFFTRLFRLKILTFYPHMEKCELCP